MALGDSDWKLVSLDLSELIADSAKAAAFQRAKALRLTVKPATSGTGAEVTGQLLVNGIWFSAAGPESTDTARLALTEKDSASFSAALPRGVRGAARAAGLPRGAGA